MIPRGSTAFERISACAALALVLFLALAQCPAWAAMDEASLIAAWEEAVIGDPETLVLEPLGDNRYHFETMRFPYNGELRVLNTSIDRAAGALDYPMGVVEVELTDADEGFLQRHAMSYGQWAQNNILFYDQANGRWLTTWELDDVMYAGGCDVPWYSSLLAENFFWLVFLLVFVLMLIFAIRKSSRQMKKAMSAQDQALSDNRELLELARQGKALQEEALAVLKEIAAKLDR